ncbi:MAG: hypothetical protein IJ131_11410 [Eggerthellaceae bacterium]|nr:hypothetical protein [Eggerthellaceae bacterium]
MPASAKRSLARSGKSLALVLAVAVALIAVPACARPHVVGSTSAPADTVGSSTSALQDDPSLAAGRSSSLLAQNSSSSSGQSKANASSDDEGSSAWEGLSEDDGDDDDVLARAFANPVDFNSAVQDYPQIPEVAGGCEVASMVRCFAQWGTM